MLFSCVEIWLKCTAVKPSLRNACKSKSDSSGVCSARLVIVLSCFIAFRACRWLVQSELEYLMKMEGAQSKTPKGRKGRVLGQNATQPQLERTIIIIIIIIIAPAFPSIIFPVWVQFLTHTATTLNMLFLNRTLC
jgi:hypothetical protein